MLAFIRANYRKGDTIQVTTSEGTFEGTLIQATAEGIVLQLPNGNVFGASAADLRTFTAASPIPMVPAAGHDYQPAEDEVTEEEGSEAVVAETEEEAPTTRPTSIGDVIKKKKEAEIYTTEVPETDASLKVVGRISLDQLKRIDPKSSNRPYFKSPDYDKNDDYQHNDGQLSNDDIYIPPMGRISFYNREKRYGFIHDFKNDFDLYFHTSQVADHKLFERLYKGTKVVYSVGENQQGHVAQCIHLPHTIDELLDIADENIEKGFYQLAYGVLEHVLEADPNNADALDMSIEVKGLLPRPAAKAEVPFHDNAADATYSAAKRAAIAKDFDKAEELYKEAIEKKERLTSSIKDLLQLFVMRYKSVDTDAEREMWYDEAIKALETYEGLLPDDLSTKQYLAGNFYLPLQDYDHFLSISAELLELPELENDRTKRVFYIWQRALALHKLGRDEEALAAIHEGLEIIPTHSQLRSLLKNLNEAATAEEATVEEEAEEATEEAAEAETTEEASEAEAADEAQEEEAEEEAEEEPEAAEQEQPDLQGEPQSEEWWDSLKKRF